MLDGMVDLQRDSFEIDWLKRWALYSPRNTALKDGETGRELSYAELFDSARKAAAFLQKNYSVGKGDRVAILSKNELEYVVLFFALHRLGAILVPVNFRLTAREIAHIVSDAGAKLLIYENEYQNVVEELSQDVKVPHRLSFETFVSTLQKESALYSSFLAAPHDPCMILYTSGTTGAPKGAVITHQGIFWNSINTTLRLNLSQNDCTVIFLPFFHTGGWNVLTTPFFHRGGKIVLLKKFDAEQILQLSEKEKATILFGVPTTMDMMARHPQFEKFDLSKIRYAIVGGEPMPIELIRTWEKRNVPIRQGYGLTEFGPNVFSLNQEDSVRKIGSIGFPNFYIDVRVVGDQGQELGAGEIGELALRGPMMMKEYWQNTKATTETIRDGWLYTGDLVKKDDEGYFYVVGRKKDMYISGGENVYPPEVEQVLLKCPGIREVAVIGVPDEKWGEVGKAFIVLEENSKITEEDVKDHCLKNLAKFKIPKHFAFISSLPKGDSGKILKRKLQS